MMFIGAAFGPIEFIYTTSILFRDCPFQCRYSVTIIMENNLLVMLTGLKPLFGPADGF